VLRDGLSLGQVHLSEVSQGGEVGHATEDAVAELRDRSGTQFDPQVVAAPLKRLRLRVPALSPSASAASAS
jgi:hypothetical protein